MKHFLPFRKLNYVLSTLVIFFSFSFAALAQTTSWIGNTNNWNLESNWTNGVPTETMNCIVGDASFTGNNQPSMPDFAVFSNLTIGGARASRISFNAHRTINDLVILSNGTLDLNHKTLTLTGNILVDGTYERSTHGKIIFAGTEQSISGGGIPDFGTITISAGTTVTFSNQITGKTTVDGTLIATASARLQSGSLTVSASGKLVVSAATFSANYVPTPTFTAGSTVEYGGDVNQTISNYTYTTLIISGAGVKSLTANLTSLTSSNASFGNIFVNGATLDIGTFNANRGTSTTGGTLAVADGATLKIGGASNFPLNYATVSLSAASTVEYSGAAQTVSNRNYGHLTLSGSGVKTMPTSDDRIIAGNFTMNGTASATTTKRLIVQGNITLSTGTTFSAGGQNHTLGGDWTNNGATITPTNSTFLLNSSSDQTIGGTVAASFYKITVEKPAGQVVLSRDVTITNTLSLKKGIITTNAFKVIIPSGGSVSDASATTGWVAGNLQKYFSGSGYFEIGTNSYYTPIRMEFNSITTAGSLIASTVSSAHPNAATASIANNKITRYWSLKYPTSGAISFVTGKLTFTWNSADNYENQQIANMVLARYNSGSWSYPVLDGTPTITQIKANLVPSALGDFTVGQGCAANFSYSAPSYCNTANNPEAILNAGAIKGVFSATPYGLSINTSTGTINLASSAIGTYTITNSVVGTCATSATTTVAVVGLPSATIAYPLTPYCASGNAKPVFTGTTGGVFTSTAGLVIKAEDGEVDLSHSRPDFYTVTYTVPATGGCPMFQTTSQPFTMGKAIWKGGISTDWREGNNWSCGSKPSSSDSVIIPLGTPRYPVMSTEDGEARDINIAAGASLKVMNKRLEISGQIINNGLFEVTNNAKLEFMGATPQTIPASVFANNAIPGLTINNETSVTLMGPLDITHILTVSKGTLYTNGHLTLKSTQANTARLAEVTSSALQPIVGEVTVERYVPGRRKYRLIASSVTTSSKTSLNLDETSKSIWGAWQNNGVAEAGKGTLITGGSSADGFDTQTSNASLYTYNAVTRRFVAFNTASGKKTKYTPLKTGEAYYMFVYGDRLNKINAAIPNQTVLKAKGTLAIGNQVYTTTTAIPLSPTVGSFTLLGNPYACTVDWRSVSKSNVSSTVWTWDANLNSTGGYVTVTSTLLSDLVSPISSLVMASRYIQPGQGFFVKTTNTNPQVVIKESHKIDDEMAINSNVFRTAGSTQRVANAQPLMALNLIYTSGGSPVLADGAIVAFDSSYSKEVTDEDGQKMANGSDVLGLVEDSTLLSIDTRPFPRSNDTLALNLTKLTKSQYTLEIFAQGMGSITTVPLLQDTYLNKLQPLSLTDTNRVVFNVTSADPASSDPNRFRIVFSQNTTLPVTFVSVAATKKEKLVQVDWRVANESSITKYEVERSSDGVSFVKIGEVAAKNSGSNGAAYQWVDRGPATGNNWYRIITVENNNGQLYSKAVAVMMNTGISSAAVAPNPVKNQQILVHLKNADAGKFRVFLYNHMGLEVWKSNLDHRGGSNGYLLHPTGYLSNGLYYLKLQSEKEKYILEIMVE